ncbi:unnamed protein product, partial [Rotaria sordida]
VYVKIFLSQFFAIKNSKTYLNHACYHTNLSIYAFLTQPTLHSHAPQLDHIPAVQLRNDIKARVATTNESSSSVLHSALRTYPLSAVDELPRNEALMLMIR